MTFARFADELGADTRRKRRALASALRTWDNSLLSLPRAEAEQVLIERTRGNYARDYGNPLLIFILLTLVGAAISWAVQKLLDRWFPHGVCEVVHDIDEEA
jgi:hypothetical protein